MSWPPLGHTWPVADLHLVDAPDVTWRVERTSPPLVFSKISPIDAAGRAGNRFDVPGAGVLYTATEPVGARPPPLVHADLLWQSMPGDCSGAVIWTGVHLARRAIPFFRQYLLRRQDQTFPTYERSELASPISSRIRQPRHGHSSDLPKSGPKSAVSS